MSFWDKHGFFFILFMFFFPRLTLIFSSVAFGGFFWWLGWIFAPRLLVAVLATFAYLHTNPALVFFSWVWAATFEVFEKRGARWTIRTPHSPFRLKFIRRKNQNFESNNASAHSSPKNDSSKKYGNDIIDV